MPEGQAYASSAAEWKETLGGCEAKAPAREGNGFAVDILIETFDSTAQRKGGHHVDLPASSPAGFSDLLLAARGF